MGILLLDTENTKKKKNWKFQSWIVLKLKKKKITDRLNSQSDTVEKGGELKLFEDRIWRKQRVERLKKHAHEHERLVRHIKNFNTLDYKREKRKWNRKKKKLTSHFHGKYQFTDPDTSTKSKQDKYKEKLHLGTL